MEAFIDKLLDITRHHADEISKQWCKAVKSNPRTPSYHSIPDRECISQPLELYKNLRWIYDSEKPYVEVHSFFSKYAEDRYKEKIPLHEAIYALIMMRRHLWLYADFQGPFLTNLDRNQAVGTINKTIRIFDHGIYIVIKKYDELSKSKEIKP